MLRVDGVLTFGTSSELAAGKVKPFVADEVKVLCESFLLSVIAIKTLISNIPRVVSIDVNAYHAYVMNCFYDVWDAYVMNCFYDVWDE